MRKFLKNSILDIFQTIFESHNQIKRLIDKKDFESAGVMLDDCRNAAAEIGAAIESSEGEGFVSVGILREYCETVLDTASKIIGGLSGSQALKAIDSKLTKAENSVRNDIEVKLHIAFFPYKASMWTSFESIWAEAVKSERCEVSVVVIPYCEYDGNLAAKKWVYEAGLFPRGVSIVPYQNYNLELQRPDIAFIHNAYDGGNNLTSVLPYFYSDNIKKYAECLVYSPYFTFGAYTKGKTDGFFLNSGSANADRIVVQSPFTAELYRSYGFEKKKLLTYGSPKIDSVITHCGENSAYVKERDMPEEWKKKLLGREKVFLLSTHWAYFLRGHQYQLDGYFDFAQKYHNMFVNAILKNNGRCGVIWRPHPLMMAALEQRCPQLLGYVREFTQRLEESDFAVVDRQGSYIDAFNCSDAMVSTYSSLLHEYMATGKPIQIFQSKPTDEGGMRSPIDYRKCYFFFKKDGGMTFNEFINMVLDGEDPMKEERMNMFSTKSFMNTDGSAGRKILERLISEYGG